MNKKDRNKKQNILARIKRYERLISMHHSKIDLLEAYEMNIESRKSAIAKHEVEISGLNDLISLERKSLNELTQLNLKLD